MQEQAHVAVARQPVPEFEGQCVRLGESDEILVDGPGIRANSVDGPQALADVATTIADRAHREHALRRAHGQRLARGREALRGCELLVGVDLHVLRM